MSSTSLNSNDDYESRVESDLEDVREDTMEQETASSSVSVASRPSSLSSAEKNSSKHKENDLQIIDLEVEDIMVENEVNKNEDTISSTSPNVTQIDQESVTEDDESVTSFPPPRSKNSEVIVVGADTTIVNDALVDPDDPLASSEDMNKSAISPDMSHVSVVVVGGGDDDTLIKVM